MSILCIQCSVGWEGGWVLKLIWTWWRREKSLPILGVSTQLSSTSIVTFVTEASQLINIVIGLCIGVLCFSGHYYIFISIMLCGLCFAQWPNVWWWLQSTMMTSNIYGNQMHPASVLSRIHVEIHWNGALKSGVFVTNVINLTLVLFPHLHFARY